MMVDYTNTRTKVRYKEQSFFLVRFRIIFLYTYVKTVYEGDMGML